MRKEAMALIAAIGISASVMAYAQSDPANSGTATGTAGNAYSDTTTGTAGNAYSSSTTGTAGNAYSDTTSTYQNPSNASLNYDTTPRRGGSGMGWIGLLGLIGLIGLRGPSRETINQRIGAPVTTHPV